MNKNILVITQYFYPTIEIAAIRQESIIKHFAANGWNVYVLTRGEDINPDWGQKEVIRVNEPIYSWFRRKKDATEKSNIKGEMSGRIKSFAKKYFKLVFKLYYLMFWVNKSYSQAKRLIDKYNIEFVISTVPEIEPMIIGKKLKKAYKNLKHIVEFRDILAFNDTCNHTKFYNHLLRMFEKSCNKYCDKYIFLTTFIQDNYKNLIDIKSSQVITNGVSQVNEKPNEKYSDEGLVISYLGTLYGSRNPILFLEAFGQVVNEKNYEKYRKLVKVNIVGWASNDILYQVELMSKKYDILDMINIAGVVQHEKALEIEYKSDINLLITHQQGSEYAIPGKMFEYIGSRRPILALTNDMLVKDIINENNIGWIASNTDVEDVKVKLREILDNYKSIKKSVICDEVIQKYSRQALNKRLEEFILT